MAEPTIEEVNKKAELAKAEKARLDAEKAQLDAEKALVTAQTELVKLKADLSSAGEKTQLDAEKAVQDSRKAMSDSKKAADLSAAQAKVGTVAGSNLDGTTTLKADAGKGEATLLVAQAVATAGVGVATAILDKVAGKKVFLLAGS